LTPSLSTLWVASGTALASPKMLLGFSLVSALGASQHRHPFDRLYNCAIRPLAHGPQLPDNPPPRRFAMALSAAWAATAAALFATGIAAPAWSPARCSARPGATVATTHFCFGSWLYRQLVRLRHRATPALDRGAPALRWRQGGARMNVDVIVVGSGQAGVPLAVRLAQAGRSVMLIERASLGGTCVNYGCTPTKTMVASARAAHVARTSARLGVRVGDVRVDFGAVVARKDAVVERWRAGVQKRVDGARARLKLVRGAARFVGEREIEVGGERHRAETVILNVGARPRVPAIPGLGELPWLDNHRAMDLRELPRHLIVLGGGYIGCELGQMFRRFGADVTLVDHHQHILAGNDPDVSAAIEGAFRAEGIALQLGAAVDRVAGDGRGGIAVHAADGSELRGSHLLVAVGRVPNTDDLGCDAGGIKRDERGAIVVDDHYRTSAAGTFAVGDVTGGPQFTHTSWDDHRRLYDALLGRPSRPRSDRVVPWTVFTDPQVAHVGLSETEARRRGVAYEIATMPFGDIARAIETDETAGTMKLIIDARDERILGATIVGADAGELIHIFVPLVQARMSARPIVDAEFVHPTFAEGVQSLVMRLPRYALD
jgi:pyruvate/2-oxoglutarate dehydrogenase complex dihydrolipoamide dehydrogenase (E3) component